jgi:hypothetical protein
MGITALLVLLPGLVDESQLHAVGALDTVAMRLGTMLPAGRSSRSRPLPGYRGLPLALVAHAISNGEQELAATLHEVNTESTPGRLWTRSPSQPSRTTWSRT